ncbi:hypothetical protein [Ferrimonas balearica]|uniref:hypothetical protein n=1 Tax=Ferrimonas balearica TaxID=44012 RepID=UPI001C996201|nr:hypothetical protein [Ferrimonas balearica]MBY5920187.1 hypothetical protein [Ferrimonas balearica]MBY5997128.1 hypothetical protein [Ferrimonas balearica]
MKSVSFALILLLAMPALAQDTLPLALRDDIPAQAYLDQDVLYNGESVIPPQCYTRTEGQYNPCYVCHQSYRDGRPNIMNDGDLQGSYEFSELGFNNHWQNLFRDRRAQIAAIENAEIDAYIQQDNYTPWIARLKAGDWQGAIPEIRGLAYPERAFDREGFARDGSQWVAFNYKPFPSTFWPTNGSAGDVMIRLPAPFRQVDGVENRDLYLANLSLLEMAIKQQDSLSVPALSERRAGVDLNGDGELSDAIHTLPRHTHYLGDAAEQPLTDMLYPQGTELLHTVRYLQVDAFGRIGPAPRMKEVRYMRKHNTTTPLQLRSAYYGEQKEKVFEQLPQSTFHGDRGLANNFGWTLDAHIEDKQGQLRQQKPQELAFCNGCHKTIGTTIDQVFSFARKLDGEAGWGYLDLTVQQDAPVRGEAFGEYLTYLARVGGGDEFRQNDEMLARWFQADGSVKADKVAALPHIGALILPSPQRARDLNKAYRLIVQEQSYLFGRDAVLAPAENVYRQVAPDAVPLPETHQHLYDLRLNWRAVGSRLSAAVMDSTP